jgi:hypothetical protein
MTVETFININGIECVQWTDEQGNHSMLKSAYEAQQAALSTPIVTAE